ncbi:L-serine ammonia-lyase [sulfur-oxidizing endosymbiont of Gigantopelta aegis]|uniref:L-serine ammonia-lyase n=1 Tax=sulfur-oxidizing endosymbiont of Gigantopelta aegis TaxID=2794934 RepID=UPI0018DBCA4E|nr:L-serine ammonia-lyase [sulfur-oxidizing endosymbiont of Gigantopelta aegis]
MYISVLELFKVGIGPSSSHTMGPMLAAYEFTRLIKQYLSTHPNEQKLSIQCVLKGSLSLTGKGHATDRAVALGLQGYTPIEVADEDLDSIVQRIWQDKNIKIDEQCHVSFSPAEDIIFDQGEALPEHPNGLILNLLDAAGEVLLSETYFSIGGGFINTHAEIKQLVAPLKMAKTDALPYGFNSARSMLEMATLSGLTITAMKRLNELEYMSEEALNHGLDTIWNAMQGCIHNGLKTEGIIPGGLELARRAKQLYQQYQQHPDDVEINDWLCAYAMAVNEENAAGHMVVTAPTNGAAGVIPAVLYYFMQHKKGTLEQARSFLLTASAIGGIIKHRSSISGAEVGCQGEVGVAAAMAAAGLCAVRGGSHQQVENAAEIALEHHLGMTCDPVHGLVQVPCIERNGFGAIKAYTAASLALRGDGEHFMPLDNCIAAMKQTGEEMSHIFKETSLGGLAVNVTEC